MKPWGKWLGIAAASLAGLVVIALVGVFAASQLMLDRIHTGRPGLVHAASTAEAVAQGRYLVAVMGCTGCHGQDLAGRLLDEVPDSTVYAPNLTLAPSKLSDADIDRVTRQCLLPDGRSVLVMPSHAFATLTDPEMASIIAYLRSLKPRGSETPPLRFGLMVRAALLFGIFHTEVDELARARAPLAVAARYARGRHLARIVCAKCHGTDLAGTPHDPVFQTPDLVIVGAYSRDDFHALLRTGKALGNREVGVMSQTARESLSHFRPEDADAIYDYLSARASALTPGNARR